MILILLATQFGVAQEAIVVHEGAETTYGVDNHPGNEYLWEVYKSFNPDIPADPTEFYFVGSTNANEATVHWVRAGLYFLKVNETDPTGCSNVKALAVSVISNNRSIGFSEISSEECYRESDNGFLLTLIALNNDGQPLEQSHYPLDVSFTVNGNSYSQSVSYAKQEIAIPESMFTILTGEDTKVLVEITSAVDNQNGGIQSSNNKLHTRTIFVKPEIEFTSSVSKIVQGSELNHIVEMAAGNPNSANYSWFVDPQAGTSTDLSNNTGNSAIILWDGPLGIYALKVAVTDGNGCLSDTIIQQIEIVKPDDLIVYAGKDTTISSCNPYQLQATVSNPENLNYLWKPAEGLDDPTVLNPIFSPEKTTIFTLIVTEKSGNTISDSVEITVSKILANAGEDQFIEDGSPVRLDGSTSIGKELQYLWTTFDGTIESSENTVNPIVSSIGNYYLKVTDFFGCEADDSVQVNENGTRLPIISAGNDTIIGSCNPYQLNASVSDPTGLTYFWEPDNNLNDATLLNPIFTPGITTIFILTVTHSSGITIKDTVTIDVDDIYANAGEDFVIEEGSSAMLDGTASVGESLSYLWTSFNGTIDSGENTANPIISNTGTYYLQVTDVYDCVANDSVVVSLLTYAPVANDNYDTTNFQVAVNIPVLENDYDPDGDLDPTTLSIEQYPVNGNVYINYDDYSVTYTPNDGFIGNDVFEYKICDLTAQCDNAHVYVVVLTVNFLVPEAFTPNGDNINDFFEIEGIEYYPGNSLVIVNRWGKEVYKAKNYGIDTSPKFWDGKWTTGGGNKDLPTGTYFYVLDLGNGQKPIAGSIYIDR